MSYFKRRCPNCQEEILHKSKRSRDQSIEKLCRSCGAKKRIEKYGCGKNFEKHTQKGMFSGKKNPFYGKTHTKESIDKIKAGDKSFFQTKEYKEKISKASTGKNNGMYGKSFYDVWVKKYGKQKADVLMDEIREKRRIQMTGKGNNMFGKPSPQGSGNGWSGWYKDWYFRSLKELSYAVLLDSKNIQWVSGESIKIPYIDSKNTERSYLPDFLVQNKKIVEVKPTALRNSINVSRKEAAAKKYCDEKGLVYEIIDPSVLSFEKIKSLKTDGSIIFIKRYEEKFNLLFG